ncbi:heavy-metal-associated domain-containing protein [Paenibacillus sp. YYML68]|uniref:heavy-metal-associated domain-containing protein n=1 Tax=Paenibacillus sp. YYML68 TaxID=2909250 RepID=UPI0024937200|nr:heavy-metal-associated domain-containing protein [Paenibacillus sp. YYML68]
MSRAKFKVAGMTNQDCVHSVQSVLHSVGAESNVSLMNQMVTVEYDESVLSMEGIRSALEEHGYRIM